MELKVQTSGNSDTIFLDGYTQKINKALIDVCNSFIAIGCYLWEVKEYNHYKARGYKDVVEYAEKELGFKKSATYNFINVCMKFSYRNEKGLPSWNLDSRYKDYSFSQLTEILSLSPTQEKLINSDMTVKEIREVKKKINQKKCEAPEEKKVIEVEFKEVSKTSEAIPKMDINYALEVLNNWWSNEEDEEQAKLLSKQIDFISKFNILQEY